MKFPEDVKIRKSVGKMWSLPALPHKLVVELTATTKAQILTSTELSDFKKCEFCNRIFSNKDCVSKHATSHEEKKEGVRGSYASIPDHFLKLYGVVKMKHCLTKYRYIYTHRTHAC